MLESYDLKTDMNCERQYHWEKLFTRLISFYNNGKNKSLFLLFLAVQIFTGCISTNLNEPYLPQPECTIENAKVINITECNIDIPIRDNIYIQNKTNHAIFIELFVYDLKSNKWITLTEKKVEREQIELSKSIYDSKLNQFKFYAIKDDSGKSIQTKEIKFSNYQPTSDKFEKSLLITIQEEQK